MKTFRMPEFTEDYAFVELTRAFYELSRNAESSGEFEVRCAFHGGKRLSWADLTQDFRIVVLSEAGTGKTEEIRHVAKTLRNEGKAAFFLRLEHIPDHFEDAFEVGSIEEFEAWIRSGNEGWLLLDSVDEARLRNPGDFELAIRKLGRRIAAAQQRVHILITGRPDAWRPKTDLAHCTRYLPYEPSSVTVAAVDSELKDDDVEFAFHTEEQPESEELSSFKIVALADLDRSQIEIFVAAKGISDTKAFLDEVDRADAWSFTARPQDLGELVEFWNDHGRMGSRSEIVKNSIDRRLIERDQRRADARPLAPIRVREGVRLIAAAVTMAQEQTIRVPDGADNTKGIPVADILPDWDETERAALLSRPIFDEAIYGTVRFHHRSVREFLTAEWLDALLRRETSRRKIEALLFRNQYGVDVVIPTMRPILPWLAILDDKVRERICQVAPEVLLEGGDPVKLPPDVRRRILRQVCEQIASGESSKSQADYAAVQRFANEDLVADVKELFGKYATNDDLHFFLLRMVWLGELRDALPEAKAFAILATASKYTRIAAIRAVQAVGSEGDMEELRACFLNESAELDREWLAELLEGLEPTVATTNWLLDCLAKTKEKDSHSVDELADAAAAFVQRASIELLPHIISGLNRLLDTPPVMERRHCEISQKFGWLMRAAAHAIERLIEARHAASLGCDSLSILHKSSNSRRADVDDYSETKCRFSTLVPAWPELNRASFWHEVEKSLAGLDKDRGEQLNEFWQVSFDSFWRFEESDFDYILSQIAERTSPEEKVLALSLAFRLYVMGGRDRKQRERLKKAVADDAALAERLAKYLKPPAQGRQAWKRSEAMWKRLSESRERNAAENREKWRAYLRTHPDKIRNNGLKPGHVSNLQDYLYDRTTEKNKRSNRWTNGNWSCLIEEFGEEVALAYRDGAVAFWRQFRPTLRSEGAPANKTPFAVVFGLTGLQIEAHETPGWPASLSPVEVELACRYASYELNGFPTWFPVLFTAHPTIVAAFLLNEIRYELSIKETEVHYVLSDVSWSGQWAWSELAPDLYAELKTSEPEKLSNLGYLLSIVQGSSIADRDIAMLASMKSKSLEEPAHSARWFAVWVGVEPDSAIPALAKHFDAIDGPDDRTAFAMQFITQLIGGRHGSGSRVRDVFQSPQHLKCLYLLMHQHIRAKEDIDRAGKGAYGPELRDDAQAARNSLAELIKLIPGKEAFIALTEIAKAHPEEAYRPWFLRHAKTKAETDAALDAWSPRQVRDFHDRLERTPANHRDLAELVHMRLLDLKDDLENGDSSVANLLQRVTLETDMRKFIGRELRDKAYGRYSIPQEEELADAKKPDLRFHGAHFDGPIPCELKLADKWSGPDLFERIENQLCRDYLRDIRSNRGFFVLVHQSRKRRCWAIPGSTKSVEFEALVTTLQKHWQEIALKYPGIEHIEVIGIDLTKRSS